MQKPAPTQEHDKCKAKGATYDEKTKLLTSPEGKPVLPNILFRYAALLTHGPRRVSTGGMVHIINKVFTTDKFTNYIFIYFRVYITVCVKYNPQGNLGPKRGQFSKPELPFQHICMDFNELNKYEGKKYCLVIVAMFSK